MDNPIFNETGYNGKLVSLGGIEGRNGLGRVLSTIAATCPNGVATQILSANPSRICAFFQNIDGNNITLSFGDRAVGQQHVLLHAGGSVQIDSLNPWTGSIYGLVGGADPQVTITGYEESVP